MSSSGVHASWLIDTTMVQDHETVHCKTMKLHFYSFALCSHHQSLFFSIATFFSLYHNAETFIPPLNIKIGMHTYSTLRLLAIMQTSIAQTLIAKNHNMPWADIASQLPNSLFLTRS